MRLLVLEIGISLRPKHTRTPHIGRVNGKKKAKNRNAVVMNDTICTVPP